MEVGAYFKYIGGGVPSGETAHYMGRINKIVLHSRLGALPPHSPFMGNPDVSTKIQNNNLFRLTSPVLARLIGE